MDANKLDIDALFKHYTVKEIQSIELQIKTEIEKKKEDLRVMVYNRYRDIIDAADGIHVMKTCSKQIESSLFDFQDKCQHLFNEKETSHKATQQDKIRNAEKARKANKYALAVIIKILQNSPSKIWYSLDNDEYLKAAKQYLLAQHAHVCLELEKSLKDVDDAPLYIQYAKELWTSIAFLRQTIVNKARTTFSNVKVASSAVLNDAIMAIYLLESSTSIKQIFQDFIAIRTPIISSTLSIGSSEQSLNIKDRIIDCLKAFTNTIIHLHELFSFDDNNQLAAFESQLNDTSFAIEVLKDDGFVMHKIPSFLKSVKFNRKNTNNKQLFDKKQLSESCHSWLAKCLQDVKDGLGEALKYVASLKNLVTIRDACIHFELALGENWSRSCDSLFQRQIALWSSLIAPFYYAQAKQILENAFQSTHEQLMKNLSETLANSNMFEQSSSPEVDVSAYLWSLEATKQKHQQQQSQEQQQRTVTPAIQKLCKSLDDDLSRILSDIEQSTLLTTTSETTTHQLVLAINEDFKSFHEFLASNVQLFKDKLCASLQEAIRETTSTAKVLLICRFCHSLHALCGHLKLCFLNLNQLPNVLQQRQKVASRLLTATTASQASLELSSSSSSSSAKKGSVQLSSLEQKSLNSDPNWIKLLAKFKEICKSGLKMWIDELCKTIKTEHLNKLSGNSSHLLSLDELVSWDEIEIEDELSSTASDEPSNTTSPKKATTNLKSKLHVPLVSSLLVQNILFYLSQQLTKSLPYMMIDSNLIVKDLTLTIFESILHSFNQIIPSASHSSSEKIKLTQNQALQMLFDLKFLYLLFDMKSNGNSGLNQEYKRACDSLEALIDPFDYDISTPFIQSNINKCISRTSTLFSLLNTNERLLRTNISSNVASKTSAGSIEKHNLLMLASVQQRFELLPIATVQASQPQQQQQLSQQPAKDTKLIEDLSSKKKQQMSKVTAASDQSSTSLFGFKWF